MRKDREKYANCNWPGCDRQITRRSKTGRCPKHCQRKYTDEERRERKRACDRRYNEENKERISEWHREWYKANKAQHAQNCCEYYLNHKEEIDEYQRVYQKANRKRLLKYHREWYRANHKRNRKVQRKYYESNKDKFYEYGRLRRAQIADAGPEHFTEAEFEQVCEKCGWICLRCGIPHSESPLQRDHVIPLSRGGSDAINNIQPLCLKCNNQKGIEFIDWRCEL